ncbi:MAG: hypothetical protein BIFFINMI_02288 [Phycisphaerae bacterium]|nr:hypothetical protein [Phycisphaerae bacterium]
MQIGPAGDRRAVPVLTDWLKTLAQSGINDVRGPKEVQPSTCFIRHLEALYMIGDPSAIPAIEAFAKGIPQGVGYGGFLTHFVTAGADEALTILRQKQAFADAVGRQAGLADRIAPLMEWFRTDRVARYRMYADKVTRVSPEGREILAAVAAGADAKLADAAGALLACYDRLK